MHRYVIPVRYADYPETEGVVLTSWKSLNWCRQLCDAECPCYYAAHVDGTHKIHFGKWIVVTIGVHLVVWNIHHKVMRTDVL